MNINQDTLYRYIGSRLRDRRTELKLTQKQLADALDIERTSISNIEIGLQKLPIHLLYGLCVTLNIEPADLLPATVEVKEKTLEDVDIVGNATRVPPKAAKLIRKLFSDLGDEK